MDDRLGFITRLRRERERQGLTLQQLADRTNVSVAMWAAFEDNDLTRWPTGVFARAFVREYAAAIGLDAENVVDDFCRWFPQGDRRAERMLRAQAEIVGHESQWRDEWDRRQQPHDRRRSAMHVAVTDEQSARRLRRRILSAVIDAAAVSTISAVPVLAFRAPASTTLAAVALGYFTATTIAWGASLGQRFVERYLDRLAALLPVRRRPVTA